MSSEGRRSACQGRRSVVEFGCHARAALFSIGRRCCCVEFGVIRRPPFFLPGPPLLLRSDVMQAGVLLARAAAVAAFFCGNFAGILILFNDSRKKITKWQSFRNAENTGRFLLCLKLIFHLNKGKDYRSRPPLPLIFRYLEAL